MESNSYAKCYNCIDGKVNICGEGTFCCILCKKYGDGKGNLLKEYSKKAVEIKYEDYNGNITKRKFKPPKYYCMWCKDKGYTVSHDNTLINFYNMPCSFCKHEEYLAELRNRPDHCH